MHSPGLVALLVRSQSCGDLYRVKSHFEPKGISNMDDFLNQIFLKIKLQI